MSLGNTVLLTHKGEPIVTPEKGMCSYRFRENGKLLLVALVDKLPSKNPDSVLITSASGEVEFDGIITDLSYGTGKIKAIDVIAQERGNTDEPIVI